MDYCEGGHVNDYQYFIKNGISTMEISSKLGELYSEMIFTHGYVHCDPHPGNILVRKTPKNGIEVSLLDHGLYTVSRRLNLRTCSLAAFSLTLSISLY